MRERAIVLLLATSCSFTPEYEQPKLPVANAFANGGGQGLAAADRGWRDVFGDPRLQTLIELALQSNRDLRIAALNIELTRAQYRIERAGLLPSVNATGGVDIRGNNSDITREYSVGLGASFELDLFGRVRSLRDAALEAYLATEEARRAAHLSLVSEIVAQYLRERAYDEQRILAERTLATVRESQEMTGRLLEAGQRSDLDVRTAEAQVHAARAEVARLKRLRAQAENALVLLVGQPLPAELPAPQPLESAAVVADLPAGIPSAVLLRRPDILAAEHNLRAANANIGAARAAFFPTISLTGFAGFASTALASLFTGGLVWSFSPQVSVPLFTGGRNKANLDVAKVRAKIEVARYEQAIQTAFREVADALVARQMFDEQLEAQTARAVAEQKRFEISDARYRNGIESYLSVLAAQQDLYATQQQLIEVRLQRLTNLAHLYTALGGGWRER
ncbi:MAG: efflux transporter outer membrane subunit [Deltaproteobacteria bacterium]|nr:efflux transporter outer membrane subunit [Deltaproteobacteria bacterium]